MVKRGTIFSERELVKGLQGDNCEIFEHLYKTMTPCIFKDVIGNSGSEEDAKDLFQTVMIVVTQNVKNGKYQSGNIYGYIRKVAQNLWQKELRKKGRELGSNHLPENDMVENFNYEWYLNLVKYDNQIEEMQAKLNHLDDTCQNILKQYYYEKVDLSTIAQQFNWSYQYCKKKIYGCRKKLKSLIEDQSF